MDLGLPSAPGVHGGYLGSDTVVQSAHAPAVESFALVMVLLPGLYSTASNSSQDQEQPQEMSVPTQSHSRGAARIISGVGCPLLGQISPGPVGCERSLVAHQSTGGVSHMASAALLPATVGGAGCVNHVRQRHSGDGCQ